LSRTRLRLLSQVLKYVSPSNAYIAIVCYCIPSSRKLTLYKIYDEGDHFENTQDDDTKSEYEVNGRVSTVMAPGDDEVLEFVTYEDAPDTLEADTSETQALGVVDTEMTGLDAGPSTLEAEEDGESSAVQVGKDGAGQVGEDNHQEGPVYTLTTSDSGALMYEPQEELIEQESHELADARVLTEEK
jgi:hypothetical protein